jgi:hypothetical protein
MILFDHRRKKPCSLPLGHVDQYSGWEMVPRPSIPLHNLEILILISQSLVFVLAIQCQLGTNTCAHQSSWFPTSWTEWDASCWSGVMLDVKFELTTGVYVLVGESPALLRCMNVSNKRLDIWYTRIPGMAAIAIAVTSSSNKSLCEPRCIKLELGKLRSFDILIFTILFL